MSAQDHAPSTCAATREPISRAAPAFTHHAGRIYWNTAEIGEDQLEQLANLFAREAQACAEADRLGDAIAANVKLMELSTAQLQQARWYVERAA